MQPSPIENNYPHVWDLVLNDINGGMSEIEETTSKALYNQAAQLGLFIKAYKENCIDTSILLERVKEDIVERNAAGISKYGIALQPFNGRDALQDAYEEVLDLIVYLRQRIYEEQYNV